VHPGAAAGTADDDQGQLFFGGSLYQPRKLLADDRSHASHDERRIGDAKRHSPRANHAAAHQRCVAHSGSLLLGLQTIGVWFLIRETERIGRHQLRKPFLKRSFVEHLANSLGCGNIEVIVALRANIQ
jgi:hypothetical protein